MSFSDNFTNAGAQQALNARSGWTAVSGGDPSEVFVPSAGSNLHTNPSFNVAIRCTDQASANHLTRAAVLGTSTSFVCVRLTDRDNFIGFRHDGTSWQVFKRVAGTFTQLGSDYTVALTSGDIGELTANGDTITFTVNSVARCLGAGVTESFNNTETRQGVVARSAATPWIDDFYAEALGGGGPALAVIQRPYFNMMGA
jgi:hypothetical protein